MAKIIGGIGTSHVPTIGLAYDRKRQEDPAWAPLFEGYKPVAKWLEEQKPDLLLFFYNDQSLMAVGHSVILQMRLLGRLLWRS